MRGRMTDEGRKTRDDGRQSKRISSVRELKVYRQAFQAAMEIFEISKSFPKEEVYGIVSQLRRAALSVVLNYVEGYARGRNKVHKNFLTLEL